MKHIRSIGSAAMLGSVGIAVVSVISGCSSTPEQDTRNHFLVVEQQKNGSYVVVEDVPTEGPNRAIVREYDENGQMSERFMNETELHALAQQEYEKMQAGQSDLNMPPQNHDGGMGLGSTILAVAAGSLLGSVVGNALMNNSNFQRHRNNVNRSANVRNANRQTTTRQSTAKKSYFNSTKRPSNSRTYSTSRFGG